MKAIRKMDEYLICKHWRLFFLLFFGICIGGGTLCLWLMARGGSGFRLMINFTLAAMMFLAGSFVVPLTVWLEEKEIGFLQLLTYPIDRKTYARTKLAEILRGALFCLIIGTGGFVAGMLRMRAVIDFRNQILPYIGFVFLFFFQMLMTSATMVFFQLTIDVRQGMFYGLLFPDLPLRILTVYLILGPEREKGIRSAKTVAALLLLALIYLFFISRAIVKRCQKAVTDGSGLCG